MSRCPGTLAVFDRGRRMVTGVALGASVVLLAVGLNRGAGAEGGRFSVEPLVGSPGGPVFTRSIDACVPPGGASGPEVEVVVVQGDDAVGGASFPIDAGGHWSGSLLVSEEAELGSALIEARCYATDDDERDDEEPPYAVYAALPFTVIDGMPCPAAAATIAGTDGPDRITGTPGPDIIFGLGGNDDIAGVGGDDIICGGAGDDSLAGGDGNDQLFGDEGVDRLTGGNGNDRLVGGPANDRLAGGPGSDDLIDRAGSDYLAGGDGDDLLDAADGVGGDALDGGAHVHGDACEGDPADVAGGACTP